MLSMHFQGRCVHRTGCAARRGPRGVSSPWETGRKARFPTTPLAACAPLDTTKARGPASSSLRPMASAEREGHIPTRVRRRRRASSRRSCFPEILPTAALLPQFLVFKEAPCGRSWDLP